MFTQAGFYAGALFIGFVYIHNFNVNECAVFVCVVIVFTILHKHYVVVLVRVFPIAGLVVYLFPGNSGFYTKTLFLAIK